MNKFIGIGNLTKEGDLKYSQSGVAVCKFTVAINNPRKKEDVLFLNVIAFNKLAENVASYTGKGSKVCVEGRLTIRKYEKDGQNRWATEVIADSVEFLDRKAAAPAEDEWADMGEEVF